MSQPQHSPVGQPPLVPYTSTLAKVALGLAIGGTIFSVIKGALIIGWILLPIAFIISIVALVQKHTKKTIPTVALIISIVGSIIGAIFFVATAAKIVGDAIDEAGGGKVSVGTQPGATKSAADKPADKAPAQQAPAQHKGTREDPLPLKTPISNNNWKVVVNSFTPDATKQVLAANEFNDKPEAGKVYALANVTVTYTGDDKGLVGELSFAYVTKSGNVVSTTDAIVVAPKPLDRLKELYKGASATGNIVLQIPKDDAGVLRVSPGILADDVFYALK